MLDIRPRHLLVPVELGTIEHDKTKGPSGYLLLLGRGLPPSRYLVVAVTTRVIDALLAGYVPQVDPAFEPDALLAALLDRQEKATALFRTDECSPRFEGEAGSPRSIELGWGECCGAAAALAAAIAGRSTLLEKLPSDNILGVPENLLRWIYARRYGLKVEAAIQAHGLFVHPDPSRTRLLRQVMARAIEREDFATAAKARRSLGRLRIVPAPSNAVWASALG
jgi:hypothetical protein